MVHLIRINYCKYDLHRVRLFNGLIVVLNISAPRREGGRWSLKSDRLLDDGPVRLDGFPIVCATPLLYFRRIGIFS